MTGIRFSNQLPGMNPNQPFKFLSRVEVIMIIIIAGMLIFLLLKHRGGNEVSLSPVGTKSPVTETK